MNDYLNQIARIFLQRAPAVDFWLLRAVEDEHEALWVRQGILQPVTARVARGALINVINENGMGYAATSDLTPAGLSKASDRAQTWARSTAGLHLLRNTDVPHPRLRAHYATPVEQPWDSITLADKVGLLHDSCNALKINPRIVDWESSLGYRRSDVLLVSSTGAHIEQRFEYVSPGLAVAANQGSQTQRRTGGGARYGRQGGLEQLRAVGFPTQAQRIAEEAIALLDAPECPNGNMDLLLMPSQMALQIHESIGHPLELDRILGDERNYAGTSFVTRGMFGHYRYGSSLLNVTFDPTRPEESASYAYDDEGTPAEKAYLIRNGVLERPLGSATSQMRSGLSGTANARASDWFRPPIDRMANLNLEPGASTLSELVAGIGRGVLMDSNRSWSIDDSRNKFQFGCELGRLIEDGELKGLVRNPNYRGISATFWRNLAGVGNNSTFEIQGVSNCGKGEPNQLIHVGHASPACVFQNVAVFGGG